MLKSRWSKKPVTSELAQSWESLQIATSNQKHLYQNGLIKMAELTDIHVFVMANIFRRPIIVLGQSYMDPNHGMDLCGVYLPLLSESIDCEKSPITLAYHNNHFEPLFSYENVFSKFVINHVSPDAKHCVPLSQHRLKQLNVHFLSKEEEKVKKALLERYLNISIVKCGDNKLFAADLFFVIPPVMSIELSQYMVDWVKNENFEINDEPSSGFGEKIISPQPDSEPIYESMDSINIYESIPKSIPNHVPIKLSGYTQQENENTLSSTSYESLDPIAFSNQGAHQTQYCNTSTLHNEDNQKNFEKSPVYESLHDFKREKVLCAIPGCQYTLVSHSDSYCEHHFTKRCCLSTCNNIASRQNNVGLCDNCFKESQQNEKTVLQGNLTQTYESYLPRGSAQASNEYKIIKSLPDDQEYGYVDFVNRINTLPPVPHSDMSNYRFEVPDTSQQEINEQSSNRHGDVEYQTLKKNKISSELSQSYIVICKKCRKNHACLLDDVCSECSNCCLDCGVKLISSTFFCEICLQKQLANMNMVTQNNLQLSEDILPQKTVKRVQFQLQQPPVKNEYNNLVPCVSHGCSLMSLPQNNRCQKCILSAGLTRLKAEWQEDSHDYQSSRDLLASRNEICSTEGCEFYSSEEYNGLCSGCFMKKTKEEATAYQKRLPSAVCITRGCINMGQREFNGKCYSCHNGQVSRVYPSQGGQLERDGISKQRPTEKILNIYEV